MSTASNRRAQLRAAQQEQARKERNKKITITAIVVVLVAAAIIAGLVLAQNREEPVDNQADPVNLSADGKGLVVNPDTESDTVVEVFFDYQCPACGALERSTGGEMLAGAERGDYQLVYRPMNFMEANVGNDMSTKGITASVCYAEVGDYGAYSNAVFMHQPQQPGEAYTDELFRDTIPAELGLGAPELEQFHSCLDSGKYDGFADHSNEQASRDRVTATPTIRVNGNEMDRSSMTSPDQWMQFVEQTA